MKDEPKTYKSPDKFDRLFGELAGLPDVTQGKPSTVVTSLPIIGQAQTWVVQTLRQSEVGDYIFVQYIDSEGGFRFVIPPQAAAAIARQADAISTKNRKRSAKASAQARKARGEQPAFLNSKKVKRYGKKPIGLPSQKPTE